jgi:hypothetical protein
MTYWSILAGTALFGFDELGARVGSVAMALLALFGVYYVISRMRGRRAGILCAMVLLTAPQFYLLARQAAPDIHLLTGYGLGLLFLCLGRFGPRERRDLHYALGYVGLATSLLVGGYPVVAGAALVSGGVYGVVCFDGSRFKQFARSPEGRRRLLKHVVLLGIVLLVIVGPWIGRLLSESRGVTARVDAPPAAEELRKPFYFYFRPLIYGLFPWSCFIPLTITSLVRWRERDALERHGLESVMLIVSVVTFASVAMQTGKWPSYISPMLVPAAVLIGLVLDRLAGHLHSAATRLAWVVVTILYVPAMLDLVRDDGVEYLLESVTTNGEVPDAMLPVAGLLPLVALPALILGVSVVLRSRMLIGALVLAALVLAGFHGGILVPSLEQSKSMKPLCESWKQQRTADGSAGFLGDEGGAAHFYCDAQLETVHEASFLQFMDPQRPAFCIVANKEGPKLSRLYRKEYAGKSLKVVDSNATHALIANHDP